MAIDQGGDWGVRGCRAYFKLSDLYSWKKEEEEEEEEKETKVHL